MSGYVYFEKTGVQEIDLILDRVYSASRAYHHTSGWVEPYDESKGENSENYVDRIQQAANEAAKALQSARQPIETAPKKEAEFEEWYNESNTAFMSHLEVAKSAWQAALQSQWQPIETAPLKTGE